MSELPVYRRFGASDDEYRATLVLRDGVPQDVRPPIITWLVNGMTESGVMGRWVHQDTADKVTMLTGVKLSNGSSMSDETLTLALRAANDETLLALVDALLYLFPRSSDRINHLTETLRLGRSKYTVGPRNGTLGLVDRIAEGEEASIDRLGDSAGAAGALLKQSFSAAFGLNPSPGEAYKMAVKAVETAAHLVIEPKNAGATLGTMLAVMRNAPVKWTLPLEERADHTHGNEELLIATMQSLWDGQEDRHRDGVVDLEEARAAFHAAVALVGWFHDGLVRHGAQ